MFSIKTNRPNWLEYLIPALALIFFLFGFFFIDIGSLTGWSCTLIDSIVDGKLYSFYDIVHKNPLGTYHKYFGYNFLVIIPWSIWNIPLWVAERFFNVDILNVTIAMAWSKLFLYVVAAFLVIVSRKFMKLLKIDELDIDWMSYLMIGSPFLFLGVGLAGQNDIIIILLATIGVYKLIQGDEKQFIIFMVLSMASKPFYIFSYVAVILLIEKNIFKIVLKSILPVIPMVLFMLIFWNAPTYQESVAGGSMSRLIEGILGSSIPIMNTYAAPLFVICLVMLYIIAFCQNDDEKRPEYILYMMIAPLLIYFAFCNFEFYRLIYMAPFLFMLIGLNKDRLRLNVLIETYLSVVGMGLSFLNPIIDGPLSGDPDLTDVIQLSIKSLKEGSHFYGNIADLLLAKIPFVLYLRQMAAGGFVALILVFLIINEPTLKNKFKFNKMDKCERWVYWVSPLSLVACVGLLIICGRSSI